MFAVRAIFAPNTGRLKGTAARVPFDGIMAPAAISVARLKKGAHSP
jgi:hypothetical protein